MKPLSARTKLACRLARIDPGRLNEAIHLGKYPCAPMTVAGSSRKFHVDDIVVLGIYAELMAFGLSAERSGGIACDMLERMCQHPDQSVFTVIRTMGGADHVVPGEMTTDLLAMRQSPTAFTMTFPLAWRRARIVEELEEEARTLGED